MANHNPCHEPNTLLQKIELRAGETPTPQELLERSKPLQTNNSNSDETPTTQELLDLPNQTLPPTSSKAGETPTPQELLPNSHQRCVLVCQHQTCLKNGSAKVLEAFNAVTIPGVKVEGCSCQGQCSSGPTVRILPDETWYWQVKPNDVPTIIEEHLRDGKPVEAKLNRRVHLSWEMFSP